MHAAVIMPDHVHLLFTPLDDDDGVPVPISLIMKGIKGSSARSVNRALGSGGSLWQDESFDRVVRTGENVRAKALYICENPVRAGLVKSLDDYPWKWREWVEGAE